MVHKLFYKNVLCAWEHGSAPIGTLISHGTRYIYIDCRYDFTTV